METRLELERRGLEQVLSVHTASKDCNNIAKQIGAAIGITRFDSIEPVVRKLRMLTDSIEEVDKKI